MGDSTGTGYLCHTIRNTLSPQYMVLTTEDLAEIEKLIVKHLVDHLAPIRKDLAAIKEDVNLLANLCQLDEIRKDPRLRKLYIDLDRFEG